MYGTLKKIFAFAGSKKGILKKSLLFAFLSGLFSAMQFAALFVVIGALVSDNRDGSIVWISLGIMTVSLIGRIITTYFSTMQDMMDHSENAREVAAAGKRKDKLAKQLKECREYDEKISHLALSRIELDLDDGVKVNYRKLQTAQDGKFYEVLADSKNIMVKEKK